MNGLQEKSMIPAIKMQSI